MTEIENTVSPIESGPDENPDPGKHDSSATDDHAASVETRVIHDKDHSKGRITISESMDKSKAFISIWKIVTVL